MFGRVRKGAAVKGFSELPKSRRQGGPPLAFLRWLLASLRGGARTRRYEFSTVTQGTFTYVLLGKPHGDTMHVVGWDK